MNQILKNKQNVQKLKEVRARFKGVKVDQADVNFVYITKICFMSYDLKVLSEIGVRIVGVFARDDKVEIQIKL